MYGSYPPGYLKRVNAVFPDAEHTIHIFAGSLPRQATRHCVTVDLRYEPEAKTPIIPGVRCNALQLPFLDKTFDLGIADPPYSEEDAEEYGTPMPNRRKTLYEAHRVIEPGGFLVWLDCTMPMYSKTFWNWCGAIGMWRSTNHRIRGVMLFQRMPQPGETYREDANPVNLFSGV